MREKTDLTIPVKCGLPECNVMFIRNTKDHKYCCQECKDKMKKARYYEYRDSLRNTKTEPMPGKVKYKYIETVKCPRCGSIYTVPSDTQPGKVMRREYCVHCKHCGVDYYDIFASAGLSLR